MTKRKRPPGTFKPNRKHNTRRYKAHEGGITYATSKMWTTKVVRSQLTPEQLEQLRQGVPLEQILGTGTDA